MSSHKDRMNILGEYIYPPPSEMTIKSMIDKLESDSKTKANFKKIVKKSRARISAQIENGARFPMDEILRLFLSEYNHRFMKFGFLTMPSSFNIGEALMEFDEKLYFLSLRDEVDHLFSFYDFIDFVTSENIDISDVSKYIEDGIIYSFNSISNPGELTFSIKGGPEFAIAGVTFIKHESEFSIFLLGGERSDTKLETKKIVSQDLKLSGKPPFKEQLKPDPSFKLEAVPLNGNPAYWQSIVMTRIDLLNMTYNARYYMKDFGKFYTIITDDIVVFSNVSGEIDNDKIPILKRGLRLIENYSTLFELCKISLFLPIYFKNNEDRIIEETHVTKLRENNKKYFWKTNNKYLSSKERIYLRNVPVLRRDKSDISNILSLKSPELKRDTSGYWRSLPPNEIGFDKNGKQIHGKTWITKNLIWYETKKETIQIDIHKKKNQERDSFDPGIIYVMRSAAHANDIFKVGMTRRTSDIRAKELSQTTSSPDSFLTVQEWKVSECIKAEKEIHRRLDKFRLTSKREFFQIPYKEILRIINQTISDFQF